MHLSSKAHLLPIASKMHNNENITAAHYWSYVQRINRAAMEIHHHGTDKREYKHNGCCQLEKYTF